MVLWIENCLLEALELIQGVFDPCKTSPANTQQCKSSLQGGVHLSVNEQNLNNLPSVGFPGCCKILPRWARYIDVVSLAHGHANQEAVIYPFDFPPRCLFHLQPSMCIFLSARGISFHYTYCIPYYGVYRELFTRLLESGVN